MAGACTLPPPLTRGETFKISRNVGGFLLIVRADKLDFVDVQSDYNGHRSACCTRGES